MGRPIDVMIVGAQKAGTTSLLRYLGEHPKIICHPQKEFAYFLDTEEYEHQYKKAYNKYFSDLVFDSSHLLLAKSASLYANEQAISRLHENNPNCEIIFILRNPVERTYSSFLMEKYAGSVGFEFDEISKVLKQTDRWEYNIFINLGMYANHLKTIYKYFPKNQVTIVFYEDLKLNAAGVCKNIFDKLKIDGGFVPNVELKHNVTHKSISSNYAKVVSKILHKESSIRKLLNPFIPRHKAYKYGNILRDVNKTKDTYSPMNEETKTLLLEFFEPFNKELSILLNKDLSHWNK